MLSVPPYAHDANDPGAPEQASCADCGDEGLTEDDRIEVEGSVMCRACGLAWLAQLADVVLGHDYRRVQKIEAAKRLDREIVTFKALVRELEREVGGLL